MCTITTGQNNIFQTATQLDTLSLKIIQKGQSAEYTYTIPSQKLAIHIWAEFTEKRAGQNRIVLVESTVGLYKLNNSIIITVYFYK